MLQKMIRFSGKNPINKEMVIRLVTVANRFVSNVMLEREGVSINGKSMLALLSITVMSGSDYMLVTSGEDEQEALRAISLLFEDGQE